MDLDLKQHVSSREKKQTYVNRLFETIAPRYDFFTRFMSYGMDGGWKRELVRMAKLEGHETTLDLACGTGDITFALAHRTDRGFAVGLDITRGMLEIAERKRRGSNQRNVSFHQADIMQLPFPDSSFDCVTGGYALRNVPDIEGALGEIRRVLKPGGRFLLIDTVAPEDAGLDTFLNCVELLRDASHVRDWRASEWVRMLETRGFSVTIHHRFTIPLDGADWTKRMRTPETKVA
ncbi:MAG TPA: class I SAM-dependent methyltransferase, partial [Blastocatellia bacterium]|nr:class I SAM-dependent methyltransferase [Blastocatellia bacterium]